MSLDRSGPEREALRWKLWMRIITLLTDFGLEDGYVAAMKGVIAGIAPDADDGGRHPSGPATGRRLWTIPAAHRHPLLSAGHRPPRGRGSRGGNAAVGRSRSGRAAARSSSGRTTGSSSARSRPIRRWPRSSSPSRASGGRPTPSATFHGRDVFAPVAAHLATGVALECSVPRSRRSHSCRLDFKPWRPVAGGAEGAVQAVDGSAT